MSDPTKYKLRDAEVLIREALALLALQDLQGTIRALSTAAKILRSRKKDIQ